MSMTYDVSLHRGSNVPEFSYVEQAEYFQFLQEQMRQEDELNAYVSECMCFAEGASFKEFRTLHEAITDKASAAWEKILDFLRRMWGKFTENFNNLFNNNVDYLNRYKEIILNRPIKFAKTVTMKDCEKAIERMMTVQVQPISAAILDRLPAKEEETKGENNKLDAVRTSIVRAWNNGKPSYNPDGKDFAGWLSEFFKASDLTLNDKPLTDLNMKDIFDFCYAGAKSGPLRKNIERDKNIIEKNSNDFMAELKKVRAQKPTEQAPTTPAEKGAADASKVIDRTKGIKEPKPQEVNTSYVFSNVYGSYINEAEFSGEGNTGGGQSKETTSSGVNQVNKNITDQKEKVAGDKDRQTDEVNKAKDMKASEDELNFKANAFTTLGTNICTAKLNGISFVYGEYMQIIRAHVKSYVGNEDKGEKRATQTGTDYNDVATRPQEGNEQAKKESADLNDNVFF